MTRGLSFPALMIALLFGAIAATACLMPAQADTYWHLRAGQELWRTLHIPLDEHYSYTAAGRAWPNHEWLWQALSYALYRAGGMRLLVAGGAAVVTAAFALAYRLTVGPTVRRFWLTMLALPLVVCVWALRPQILTLLFLAGLLWLLVHERYRLLPLLFVVWANAHGAVALGGAALAAATVAAVLRARGAAADAQAHDQAHDHDRRRARALLIGLPICGAATLVTPLGFGLWRFIRESMHRSHATGIHEWLPTYPTGPVEIAFWLLAAAFLVLLARRWRRLAAASWADQASVAVAVVVLPLAFTAVRNISPFMLLALPAASRLLGRERLSARPPRPATPDHPLVNAVLAGGLLALMAGGVALAWSLPLERLGWRPLPPEVLAAVRRCPGPLYNRYNEGGFVIWFVPERRVFIDSRQDPYPLPFLLEDGKVEAGEPYRPLFDRFGVRCALLPLSSPLFARLKADGWEALHEDAKWSVLNAPRRP